MSAVLHMHAFRQNARSRHVRSAHWRRPAVIIYLCVVLRIICMYPLETQIETFSSGELVFSVRIYSFTKSKLPRLPCECSLRKGCRFAPHTLPLFSYIISTTDQKRPHWHSWQSWSYWFSRDYSLHFSHLNHPWLYLSFPVALAATLTHILPKPNPHCDYHIMLSPYYQNGADLGFCYC